MSFLGLCLIAGLCLLIVAAKAEHMPDRVFQVSSAVNPPPICVGIPHVDLLKACVKFSNISYNKDHFGGCISVGLEALGFEKDFPLGCIYSSKKESVRMRRLRRLLRRLVRRRYYMKSFSEFQRMVQRGKNARKESFGDVEN
ncbi:predicted protein [Nematostella vectensis]|uniref:DUF4773 domain-containing protein n=1 Tax=Nematostella vectensis TaxID=45351 RepID=A7T101_NEMVE|nr:predicted protein [Nematostella vectensis]|eukprot:XP_001622465.1 predicted protein [Nematostella vectensis]